MQVVINDTPKEVIFKKVYTRKIDREFTEILFEWSKISSWDSFALDPNKLQKANDYLLKAMTNLEESEIDELSTEDYNALMKEVWLIKNPEGSKTDSGKVQKDS